MPRPKLKLDPSVLQEESTESRYWRGFLASTANVVYKPGDEPRITIEVPAEDYGHLVSLKQFLKSEHSIVMYRNSARLTFISQPVAVEMYERGLLKRPYAVRRPLSDDSPDFWRGVADGAACIGKYAGYSRLQIVGEEQLILKFHQYVTTEVGVKANVRAVRGKKCVSWTGKAAEALLDHLYGGCGVANLRKQLKAASMMRPYCLGSRSGRYFRL